MNIVNMVRPPRYFSSIYTCPILNWSKVGETKDLNHLHISGRKSDRAAGAAYDQVQTEYFETFGMPDTYRMYLEQAQRAAGEFLQAVKGDEIDRWRINLGEILLTEAKQYVQGSKSEPFPIVLGKVSRMMGFSIDPKSTTIAEFYGYIESISAKSDGK